MAVEHHLSWRRFLQKGKLIRGKVHTDGVSSKAKLVGCRWQREEKRLVVREFKVKRALAIEDRRMTQGCEAQGGEQ